MHHHLFSFHQGKNRIKTSVFAVAASGGCEVCPSTFVKDKGFRLHCNGGTNFPYREFFLSLNEYFSDEKDKEHDF